MLHRRQLLQLAGVTTVAAAGGTAWVAYSSRHASATPKTYAYDPVTPGSFQQKLAIPGAEGPLGVLDVAGPLTMRASEASLALLPKRQSPFLLYHTEYAGKTYQNPVLRIESGARFTARLDNALNQPTIIHWHGLHVPAGMDGGPASTIDPGRRFDYDFTVRNRGGVYWYHSHAHGLTAEQAYKGLASFFLVDDADQRKLAQALDLRLGTTDLPIVIQDKQFDTNGRLRYEPSMQDAMMGWLGDTVLANLTPSAVHQVTPRSYRLRLLNGSNSRIYRLAFVKGETRLKFTVLGTDGGLLERPETVTEAFLAPAERLDVLFDAGQAAPGDDIFLKSLAFNFMGEGGGSGGMGRMGGMGGMGGMASSRLPLGAAFNILKLAVTAGARVTATVPATLSQITPIRTAGAAVRKIEVSMQGMRFLINGLTFRMDQIAFSVKRGAVEIWSMHNQGMGSGMGMGMGMPHPMHIHGFLFQVLERIGSPPEMAAEARFGKGRMVSDLGWKDTVLVWPGETVRIAIDFSHDFPGDQTYVFHCHNLEHGDAGMMINYRVVG